MKHYESLIVVIILLILGIPSGLLGDDHTQIDTTDSLGQETKVLDEKQVSDEIVLDEIEIKGRVEKPGVIIFPKRIEPDLPEVELERSFQRELKEGMGEIIKPDDELSQVEQVESIKKAIEKKRE